MYCPNCGAQNRKKQNFCRYCGLLLQDIEKIFLDQLIFGKDTKRLKNLRSVRRITDYTQFFAVLTLATGIIVLLLADPRLGKMLITASLLSFFLGQLVRGIAGYFQRRNSAGNETEEISRIAEQREFETKETSKLLEEKPFVPVSSIIENSTELLFVDRKPNRSGLNSESTKNLISNE